ncbi:1-deoxy-D-xylulose-5-phosphate reductoisomerase [Corynebacterium propinquum]|uniref:1-deoxy-D-xylulose-5-phosphate reductoisomerase n=1 Tax=Corynebacterium propinquum TaxID=43769 RepID=UPI00191CBD23|nr:1-deoxy-D-xylulose-5-phosphate reductoisomerase [Corynebacterium propinquum]MCG7230667.1 1-deoxy-D-xylulose-5-phosphate reductoisomerase [Corynebacterium propinquum]MDK4302296.1 1-deoxy-D-xylulose-5-phosphate reductoisomerase [Corynebacterium propinquum]MDK8535195.1 1-deoxy-D-xylulose-5-phosphate reductoisomerase [Corynebacterium propinquum]MDK8665199.1 1-deoxy-D-xylulose-5-phosphate reductoisomerase [Corynebacterium propinquum]QQU86991.1 1-deoxy-D-xylulose-5-phosphate reductoisomerase [Cor
MIGAEHKQQTVAPETDHKRTVVVVGSTGSIGTQALEVIADNPDKFELVGLAAGGSRPELLCQQARHFAISAEFLAVADKAAAQKISQEFGENIASGPDAAATLCAAAHADVVLNAMDGSRGLPVTLAALSAGSTLALANKESLVAGGRWVLEQAAEGQIVPVDSEHSAMAQALRSGRRQELSRLVLTASGGPFRGWDRERMWDVTPQQAAAHPTWSMGQMNTLNSATLVNKGLELIEASYLFDFPANNIDVVVHPQSIVHSAATFCDGSTLAQASPPSMKLPIALALAWPNRLPHAQPPINWQDAQSWEFLPVDNDAFPALDLARTALATDGLPAVFNAANEEAATAFLRGQLRFPQIVDVVGTVMETLAQQPGPLAHSLDDIYELEKAARRVAGEHITRAHRLS